MKNGHSYYILCVLCWSILLSSCHRKIDLAEIDVAEAFISTLCDTVIGCEYPHSFFTSIGDALIYLEKDCYEDFDRFITDIPNIRNYRDWGGGAWGDEPSYENVKAEPIKLVKIDTIAKRKYKVHVKAGKKFKRTIEIEVTENNRVKANFHGMGIGGRYKFAGEFPYAYPTEQAKEWNPNENRIPQWNPRTGSYYVEKEPPSLHTEGSGDVKHHNVFYVLKKKGKKRSLITYVQGGIGDYTITGWVDNKYIVQDEEHKCSYEPYIAEYFECVVGVICLIWFMMAGGAFSGAAAAGSSGGVMIFFF